MCLPLATFPWDYAACRPGVRTMHLTSGILCAHSMPLHKQTGRCRAVSGEEEAAAASGAPGARAACRCPSAGGASMHRLCAPAKAGLLPRQAGVPRRAGVR